MEDSLKKLRWDQFDSVVFDLDGTLLNSKRRVGDLTKRTLEELTRRGKKTLVATGRPWYFTMRETKRLNTPLVISCNGVLVNNSQTSEVIFSKPIEKSIAKEIFMFLRRHRATFIIYCQEEMFGFAQDPEKSSWFDWLQEDNNSRYPKERFKATFATYDDFEFDFNSQLVLEFIVVLNETDPASVVNIWEYLRERDNVYPVQSQTFVLDIMPEGVNKGTGLLELERKGLIDLSRTLVFGDQNNDLSMFEIAAFSVAMGNSRDYIKSKATFTTLSNDEDGISHFFKNFVEPEEEPEEEPQADLGFDPKDFAFQAEKQTLLKEGVVHEEQEDFETRDKEKEGSPLEEEEYLEDERELERARELAREIQEELAAEFGFDQQEDQEEREKKELKIEQKPEAKTERKDGHSCCGLNDKITCPYTKLFTIHQQFTSRFKLNSSSTLDSKLEELIEYAKNDDKDFKDDNSFNALIDELARLLSDERLGVEFALGDLNESLKLSDRFEELYDVISARIPEEVNKRWVDLFEEFESIRERLEQRLKEKILLSSKPESLQLELDNLSSMLSEKDHLLRGKNELIKSLKAENKLLRGSIKILEKRRRGTLVEGDFNELEDALLERIEKERIN